jgi:hypothetical protein
VTRAFAWFAACTPGMSRLGPAARRTPRITHEVLEQAKISFFLVMNRRFAMNDFRFYDRPVFAMGRNVVGIDIGKNRHSAFAVSPQGEKIALLASFTNDREGVERLEAQVLSTAFQNS